MPNISLLDLEDLQKGRLAPFIKKCLRDRAPDPAFHAIMGHSPDLSASIYTAWATLFGTGRIDHRLKEIIRVQLSRLVDCTY